MSRIIRNVNKKLSTFLFAFYDAGKYFFGFGEKDRYPLIFQKKRKHLLSASFIGKSARKNPSSNNWKAHSQFMQEQLMEAKTIKLYQENVYLQQADATITATESREDGYWFTADRTPFFPEGGGQSADTGTVMIRAAGTDPDAGSCASRFMIDQVLEADDAVWHRVAPTAGADSSAPDLPPLQEGDPVTLTIDWPHRFENMQRHAGEHILSGRIWALYGGTNRGFHMGEDYMTVDIRFEGPDGEAIPQKTLTLEMAMAAERAANEVIWQDLPIRVDYFDTNEEASAMPTRKPVAFDEDISIVTVGDRDDPADCCACCGTHPATAGQVGLVKVYKVEKNKDMTRVYFDAGRKAMQHIDTQLAVLTDLANANSTSPEELPARLAAEEARMNKMREELSAFRKAAADSHLAEILTALEAQDASAPLVFTFTDIASGDFSKAGKKLQKKIRGAVFAAFPEEAVLLLYADRSDASPDCGALVKDAAAFGAKGGGNKEAARAMFPDADSMERFLESLS